jgi:sulfide dehydrogenase [flavocytochrome c] flavoprotein subunit
MIRNTRRDFLKTAGAVSAVSALPLIGCGAPKRVVVVGGGFGGATAARYVKMFDPSIDVTLVEANKTYTMCPLSNTVFSGLTTVEALTRDYSQFASAGVKVVNDMVTAIEPGKGAAGEGGKVMTQGGQTLMYDRLILAPGVDFKPFAGLKPGDEERVPHAWKAGPQTTLLKKQLEALENGKNVIIVPPENPFRCPPGPYERACQIAWYLQQSKPKSKVIILDPKDKHSKMGLFQAGFKRFYKNHIEWVPAAKDGKVQRVDPKTLTAYTEFGEHKAGVLNVIPNQKAGAIAAAAGVASDSGWCPVDLATFESTMIKGIHVVGDAAVVTGMPKSGHSANTEAKACAMAVAALLKGETPGSIRTSNTCYSLITPTHGISVAAMYELVEADGKQKFAGKKGSGGLSPADASDEASKAEANYAWGWSKNIAKEIWG